MKAVYILLSLLLLLYLMTLIKFISKWNELICIKNSYQFITISNLHHFTPYRINQLQIFILKTLGAWQSITQMPINRSHIILSPIPKIPTLKRTLSCLSSIVGNCYSDVISSKQSRANIILDKKTSATNPESVLQFRHQMSKILCLEMYYKGLL